MNCINFQKQRTSIKTFQFIVLAFVIKFCLTSVSATANPLFSETQPFSFELEAPLSDLMQNIESNPMEAKSKSIPGILKYKEGDQYKQLPVKIKLRGWSSLFVCDFKKLKIKFANGTPTEGPFAGIASLDLATHCTESTAPDKIFLSASQFNHREALAYNLMKILEIPALQSRMGFVRYTDTSENKSLNLDSQKTYQAFFLENFDSFLKRVSGVEIGYVGQTSFSGKPKDDIRYEFNSIEEAPQFNKEIMSKVGLIESLVGNSDWFISTSSKDLRQGDESTKLWNIKVYELKGPIWVPFAHDFNFSSFVAAQGPSFQFSEAFWSPLDTNARHKVAQLFLDKRKEIELLPTLLTADPKGRDFIITRISEFYEFLARAYPDYFIRPRSNAR
jgi:hypothetical protein